MFLWRRKKKKKTEESVILNIPDQTTSENHLWV
jgi:hypothetical protein